ncbi:MAG: HEAT repeat domain-containing protein [Armatimonadota bacterium]
MTARLACIAPAVSLLATVASAHLCNNIYRTPDRIIVKPEKDVTSIEKTDEFRVFVKNNYPTVIDDVRLTATSPDGALEVSVQPRAFSRMHPAEKAAFTLKVTVKPGAPPGKHTLQIGISAKQVGFRPAAEATTEALRAVMKDPNPSPRVLAGESLVLRKDPAGYECLRGFISGRDREYCCRALRAAGRTGDRSLVPVILQKLTQRDGFIKGNALLALGMLRAEREQIARFVNDRDPFVATCARAALAIHGDKRVLQYLRPALQHQDGWVRVAAAWGIAAAGDKAAVQFLDQSLKGDDASFRAFIGDALVSIARQRRG